MLTNSGSVARSLLRPVAALLMAMVVLPACSPTLNWREVRPEGTRLALLLPCKPDKAQKTVSLISPVTPLSMLGCDSGGATFAVAVAQLGEARFAGPALALWKSATLANMKAELPLVQSQPLTLPGADLLPAPVVVKAQGRRADGTAVSGQAAYFSQGSQAFQVVLYADRITPEMADTFFSSLKFE